MGDEKGFTLLELIMVLFITVLSLAIVAPSLQHVLAKMQLKSNTRQMAWVLRSSQQQAIYSGQSNMVRFYNQIDAYRQQDGPLCYLEGTEYAAVPSFTTKINGMPYCAFQASGIPTSGGTVTLRNSRKDLMYVIVNPVAGRIRVSNSPPANW